MSANTKKGIAFTTGLFGMLVAFVAILNLAPITNPGGTGATGPTGPSGSPGPQGSPGPNTIASTTAILKGDNAGGAVAATANTDYSNPAGVQALIDAAVPTGGLGSGVYTPTSANESNINSLTLHECQWLRVGNVVTVSGIFDLRAVLPATATAFSVTLPVFVNPFNDMSQAGGSAVAYEVALSARIVAIPSDVLVIVECMSIDASTRTMGFSFTYKILP